MVIVILVMEGRDGGSVKGRLTLAEGGKLICVVVIPDRPSVLNGGSLTWSRVSIDRLVVMVDSLPVERAEGKEADVEVWFISSDIQLVD